MTAAENVNTTQNTRLTALESAPPPASFPATTVMLFYNAAAPTGWTKITTGINDRALRVVSGSGGVGGGSFGFSASLQQISTRVLLLLDCQHTAIT